jgi:hypothetical protein
VLLGAGDGTFLPGPVVSPGVRGNEVVVADVDVDGLVDLVVASDDSVAVLRGNGDGTFRAAERFGAQLSPAIQVVDLDGDGQRDVALAATPSSSDAGTLSVLLHR